MPVLAEQAAEQRHEGDADEGDTAACHELLHTLGLRTGVIIAVTFEQVDNTPNAETGTKSNNESLENTNSRVKKCHRLNVAERKECRYEYRTDHRICRSALLSKILVCLIFESGRSVFGILDLY